MSAAAATAAFRDEPIAAERSQATPAVTGNTLYLSPNGVDTNAGSQTAHSEVSRKRRDA
jgi:hypothetical protein